MSIVIWVWLALFVLLGVAAILFVTSVIIAVIIGVIAGFWKAVRNRR